MSKTYVIQWKSKVNGRAGRGTRHFSLEDAERLVDELNQEYPNIHHEALDPESAASEQAQAVAEVDPSSTESTENERDEESYETHAFPQ